MMKRFFKRFTNWFFSERTWIWRFVILLFSSMLIVLIGWLLGGNPWQISGYVLAFFFIVLGTMLDATLYLQDIYETHAFRKVAGYLFFTIFHIGQPTLKIINGRKDIKGGEVNVLDRIGGPGLLTVEPGSVVVLETLLAPARILGAGDHKIKRGEIVKDVIALAEYSGKIDEIKVSTRDGIDVLVSNVEFRFCINPPSQSTSLRTLQNPYPFSKKSVHDLVYNRNVSADGKVNPWMGSVTGVIKGIIVDHISAHDLDTLLSPAIVDTHPMSELRSKFDQIQNQEKIKSVGARLLWINIGNVAPMSSEIEKQRLEVWLAKQSGVEKIMNAQGEAEKISSRERGRAEAQAVLLRSIAQALQEIDANNKHNKANTAKNLWNIVMARTAQILESMSGSHNLEKQQGE